MASNEKSVLPDKLDRHGCALLAAGVVRQAIRDYQEGNDDMKTECELFFESDWFQELQEMAPDVIPVNLLRRLQQ